MTDSKKVLNDLQERTIKGLECCGDESDMRGYKCIHDCPYDFANNDKCMGDMARDALELLKYQQETIASFENTINKLNTTVQEQEMKIKGLSILLDFAHAAISHRKKGTDDRPE